jgi:iron complex outermembrane receptor protein
VNSTNPALYDRNKTQWIPLGVGYRSQDFDRTRRGDYAALQWRPNKDLTAALTYFKTRYKEDLDEHVVASSEDKWYQQVASANSVFDSKGAFQSGTISNPTYGGSPFNSSQRINTRESATRDVALNVQWRISPSLSWTNDFQHVRSTTEGFDADVSTGFILPNQTMDMTGKVPQISLGSAAYMADPKNYYWAYTQEALDHARPPRRRGNPTSSTRLTTRCCATSASASAWPTAKARTTRPRSSTTGRRSPSRGWKAGRSTALPA